MTKMETIGGIKIRKHGTKGPVVIVLHGGPGAPGSAVETAVGLSNAFRVIEPWQRGACDAPLTVATHVADLHNIVQTVCSNTYPALVGESWGAMLALAYAAQYPQECGPVVLIGCGTFDKRSRACSIHIRESRIAQYIADHPEFAEDLKLDLGARIMKWHDMTDTYRAVSSIPQKQDVPFDLKAHTETWNDMVRCQEHGQFPNAFSRIISPVMMLHGSYDPHPGKMIGDSLKAHIPQLEYREFEKCGHQPSVEQFARDAFFAAIRDWLTEKSIT